MAAVKSEPYNLRHLKLGTIIMLNTKNLSKAAALIAVLGVLATATTSSFADTAWQKKHPRREQVNNRLQNQNKRIHNEVKEGELSPGQARALHKDDKRIRQEERDMAAQNGGHTTKQEQRTLNQQENAVSKQIGK
jgi:CRISPR/Cas system-associated endoribonuclease Cas2